MEKVNRNKARMANPFEKKEVHLLADDLRKTIKGDSHGKNLQKQESKTEKKVSKR